jgi:hypothetical protein
MGQVCQCWWRICRENVFCQVEYHMCYVLYPFATYLLTLSRKWSLRPTGEGEEMEPGPGEWGRWVHEKGYSPIGLDQDPFPDPLPRVWVTLFLVSCLYKWVLPHSTHFKLRIEAACSTETSVSTSDNSRSHSPEDSSLTLTSVKTSKRAAVYRI